MTKKVISIIGPTAVGKTSLAIEIAKKLDTEIVSVDSRQIYKELKIGVARPSDIELAAVKHHLIAYKSIFDTYSAKEFEHEALQIINKIHKKKDTVVLCGGTGLFLNAIRWGMDEMPFITNEVRTKVKEMYEENGLEFIQKKVKSLDPESYEKMDIHNPRRLLRVLEVFYASGEKMSSLKSNKPAERDFEFINIFINRKRENLYARINQRVEDMIEMGLEKEVFQVLQLTNNTNTSLSTVGYNEWIEYYLQISTREQVIEKIKQHSRNYAKRQVTWCNKFYENDLKLMIDGIPKEELVAKILEYAKVSS